MAKTFAERFGVGQGSAKQDAGDASRIVSAKVQGNELHLVVTLLPEGTESTTGKSILLANTKRKAGVPVSIEGVPCNVSVMAYAPKA